MMKYYSKHTVYCTWQFLAAGDEAPSTPRYQQGGHTYLEHTWRTMEATENYCQPDLQCCQAQAGDNTFNMWILYTEASFTSTCKPLVPWCKQFSLWFRIHIVTQDILESFQL